MTNGYNLFSQVHGIIIFSNVHNIFIGHTVCHKESDKRFNRNKNRGYSLTIMESITIIWKELNILAINAFLNNPLFKETNQKEIKIDR